MGKQTIVSPLPRYAGDQSFREAPLVATLYRLISAYMLHRQVILLEITGIATHTMFTGVG
ncbi:MAG: hypothetical protein LBL45_05770 [Treponema sp.]|nr:hypothetical protein [Treponema sp.]